MIGPFLNRRALLFGSLRGAALASLAGAALASLPVSESFASDAPVPGEFQALDAFIAAYAMAMNAPGLTLGLANTAGPVRAAGFGFSDLEAKTPLSADHMFEVGSITKSFVALTLLQLREEGKLDLNRPILEYLPWLPVQANYGVITVHHLLTHSSGLPDSLGLFNTDPQARLVQGFKPGEHFHYCNAGFQILGYLIQKLDQRPWADAVKARIFDPLGMTSSSAVITNETRARRAKSYVPFFDDLAYVRQGRLAPAGNLVFDNAAGSVTSTPGDMALYLQMLLRKGQGPNKRTVSEESFSLFSHPYIAAKEFSPTAFYGYGIAIDKLDGRTILRHTGGMASFMSALMADLDGGVGAFASINAQLGYRPNPVAQYAVETMHAGARKKSMPSQPALPDPATVKNAADYANTYVSQDGRKVEVAADGERLFLRSAGRNVPLQSGDSDTFLASDPSWQRFPLIFARAETKGAPAGDKKPPVTELLYGADWYTNANYAGPKVIPSSPELDAFAGYYRADSGWVGSIRIVQRKGKLWGDGIAPLELLGGALFRLGDEPFGPETVEFFYLVDGKAQMMKFNGQDLWRVNTS
jgi:D-alanyl-D-alanine carboxypeptidase